MLVCLNYLVLNHASPAFIDRAESSFKSQSFFNEFIPINQLSATGVDEERIENWGVKTDIGDATTFPPAERGPNKIIFKFFSQDCAPIPAYQRLKDLGFELKGYYFISNSIAGVFEHGLDTHYNLDTLADSSSIPPDLVAIFDLSNSMREKRLLRHDDDGGGGGGVGEHSNKKAKAHHHHHNMSSSSSDQHADAPKTPNSALVDLTSTLNSTSVATPSSGGSHVFELNSISLPPLDQMEYKVHVNFITPHGETEHIKQVDMHASESSSNNGAKCTTMTNGSVVPMVTRMEMRSDPVDTTFAPAPALGFNLDYSYQNVRFLLKTEKGKLALDMDKSVNINDMKSSVIKQLQVKKGDFIYLYYASKQTTPITPAGVYGLVRVDSVEDPFSIELVHLLPQCIPLKEMKARKIFDHNGKEQSTIAKGGAQPPLHVVTSKECALIFEQFVKPQIHATCAAVLT